MRTQRLVNAACAIFILCTTAVVSDGAEVDWVEARVAELQPKSQEKRFDDIGWADDIRAAKRLASSHQRPVFLFTHDGRMNIGRC